METLQTQHIKEVSIQSAEREPSNKDVVRVLPIGMAEPRNVFTIWQHTTKQSEPFDLDCIWFTQSTWVVDTCSTGNTYLMLPGGEIKEVKNGEGIENIQQAAKREVWEELHLPHVDVSNELITTRNYSYGYGQNERQEFVVSANIPSFITATNVNENDRINHITLLNPAEIEELFQTEQFRNIPILDSLSVNDLPDGIVVNPEQNWEFRQNTLAEAYTHEMRIRRNVFSRYLRNRYGDTPETNDLITSVLYKENGNKKTIIYGLQDIAELNKRFIEVIGEESIREEQFLKDFQIAAEEAYFKEASEYINDSGPQASYLFGQILLEFSTITPYELEIMQGSAPELYAFYASLAEAYSTDITDPDWFTIAKEEVRRHRNIKVGAREEGTFGRYEFFEQRFIDRIGITDRSLIASYSKRTDEFLESLQEIFAKNVDRETAAAVFSNKIYTVTSSLEELMTTALGFSPYGEEDDFDMSSPQGSIPAWQALRKIIGIAQMKKIEELNAEIVGRNIYLLRQAFKSSIIDLQEIDIKTASHDMQKAILKNTEIPLLYTVGEKPFPSIVRKIIERAKFNSDNKADQIDDVLRFAVVADSEHFTNTKPEESIKASDNKGQEGIGQGALDQLLTTVLTHLINNDNTVEIRKVKASGVMMVDSLIPGKKESMVKSIVERLCKKLNGKSNNIYIENGEHTGSKASLEEKPWSWLKFVIEVNGVPCELQLYPSVFDYQMKLEDDTRFTIERLQTVHDTGRYPVVDVWFGREAEAKKSMLRNGNGHKHP